MRYKYTKIELSIWLEFIPIYLIYFTYNPVSPSRYLSQW